MTSIATGGSGEPPLPFVCSEDFHLRVWFEVPPSRRRDRCSGGFCVGLLFRGCSGSLPAIPYAKAGPALNWHVLSQSLRTMSIVIFIIFYFFLGARFSFARLSFRLRRRGRMALLAFEVEPYTKHTRLRARLRRDERRARRRFKERTTDGTDYTDGSEYDESGCPRIIPYPRKRRLTSIAKAVRVNRPYHFGWEFEMILRCRV